VGEAVRVIGGPPTVKDRQARAAAVVVVVDDNLSSWMAGLRADDQRCGGATGA